MTDFEDIIKKIGSFGRYQIRVFILVSLSETPCAWAMVLAVFTHATPKIFCFNVVTAQLNGANNASVESKGNQSGTTDREPEHCLNGTICSNHTYGEEFTSIVTEVRCMQ